MIANLAGIDSEGILLRGHEFPALFEEVNKLGGCESLHRTGVETLIGAKLLDDCLHQTLLCRVTVALHHMDTTFST